MQSFASKAISAERRVRVYLEGCEPDVAGVVVCLQGEDVSPVWLGFLCAALAVPVIPIAGVVCEFLLAGAAVVL